MEDGRTITKHEEKLAALLALAWNSHTDLLLAAKLALGSLKGLGAMNATVKVVEDAIAKAEGRQS